VRIIHKIFTAGTFGILSAVSFNLSAQQGIGPFTCNVDISNNCYQCFDRAGGNRSYCNSVPIYAVRCDQSTSGLYYYQWSEQTQYSPKIIWTELAGETSNILTVNKSGKYRCYVQHLDGWSGESWTTGEIYIRIEVEAPSIDGGTIGTRTVCDKEEIGFHVLPSYSYLSYQWRVSSDGGASWSNVSGETNSIYNFHVNPEMDGHILQLNHSFPDIPPIHPGKEPLYLTSDRI